MSVAAALGVTLILLPYIGQSRMLLFVGAVVLTSWVAGLWPGLLSIVLAVVASEALVLPPAVFPSEPAAVLRIVVFVLLSVAGTLVIERLRSARMLAERSARDATDAADRLQSQRSEIERQAQDSESMAAQLRRLNDELVHTNEQVERTVSRARGLQRVAGALIRTLTPAQVAEVLVREGVRSVDADAGFLACLSPDGRTIQIMSSTGYEPAELEPWRMISIDAPLPVSVTMRTGRAVWLPSREVRDRQFPQAERNAGDHRPSSWAVLPLTLRDHPVAVLALSFTEAQEFTADDRTFMLLLAQQSAQALERARLYDAERRARVKAQFAERQVAFLGEVSTRLGASFDYQTTLAGVARLVVSEMADWCMVHMADRDGRPYVAAAVHADRELTDTVRALAERQPPAAGAPDGWPRVLDSGDPSLLSHVRKELLTDPAVSEDKRVLMREVGAASVLSVPIRLRDEVLGAITVGSAEGGHAYTPSDLALTEEVAARVGQAIDNARLFESTRLASQAKSDFLAVMSHELRTPLNAILGYADLLLLGVSANPEDMRHQIERIRGAAHHLLQLVEEVLSYARIEAGRKDVAVETVDLRDVAREAAALAAPLAEDRGLPIRLDLPETPALVETDATKVREIVGHLLSNALKFTREGEVRLSGAIGDGAAELEVTDTGIGIPAEHQENIFEAFWQVEQSSTRRFGGTGLGLSIARELTRMLGGELSVHSEAGKGSRFKLRLPLRYTGANAV